MPGKRMESRIAAKSIIGFFAIAGALLIAACAPGNANSDADKGRISVNFTLEESGTNQELVYIPSKLLCATVRNTVTGGEPSAKSGAVEPPLTLMVREQQNSIPAAYVIKIALGNSFYFYSTEQFSFSDNIFNIKMTHGAIYSDSEFRVKIGEGTASGFAGCDSMQEVS